mgnify:FL=1
MNLFLIIPFAALILGMFLQLFLGSTVNRRVKGWLAFTFCAAAFASVLALVPAVQGGRVLDANLLPWEQVAGLALHVDGLSIVFGLMGTGIGVAILLYCTTYMEHEPDGTTRFYILMLLFILGMVGLVFSANLLTAYLCWEIIGLCSYFLVGFWYKRKEAADGARKVLIITHAAGYGFLLAILLLFHASGTFLWTDPALQAAFDSVIFFLMLVSIMAKSVQFPLHTWIPEAMNAPTPVSALLHSACYVKAGVYLIARIYSIAGWQPEWHTVVLVLGCLTMIVGALFALVQTDLKRLLAFSTISQLGYIITGLGLGTPYGIAAGLFYCLSHGLFKGTLFLCAGAVQHATGTRDMRQLGGLAKAMPGTHRIWLVAAAALIGVPLTNGFVAKWMLYSAALNAGQALVVLVAWMVSTFTAFYVLKATVSVFHGEMPEELGQKHLQDASPAMLGGMGALAGLALLFGIAPQILMKWVVSPAAESMRMAWQGSVSWLGIQTGELNLPVTAGAVIPILAALIGWAVFAGMRSKRGGTVQVFTGGDPLPEGDRVDVVDFSELAGTTFSPVYRMTDPDPLYLILWRGLRSLGGRLARGSVGLENRALLACLLLALVMAAAVWAW